MKKSNIALAALALIASTAAMAEGVTIYGTLDASITKASKTSTGFDGSGNWNGTNWGLKGSEDLDGGMKATFNVEQGLNIGTGSLANGGTPTAAGTMFNRQANVGLSGEFGGIKAGLQTSPFIGAALNGVANGNESFYVPLLVMAGTGMTAGGGTGTGQGGGFFIPNSVSYTTPTVGGITGSALTQLDSGVAANKYSAYSVAYAAGDLSVAAGYQNRAGLGGYTGTTVNAAYQMGEARLVAGYHISEPTGAAKINTYNLGVSYAVAPKTAVSLQYARNDQAAAKSIVNVGAQYTLSKTTYLYATLSQGQKGAMTLYSGAASYTTGNQTGYAIGLVKGF